MVLFKEPSLFVDNPEALSTSLLIDMNTHYRKVNNSISIISDLLILMKIDCSLQTGEMWSSLPVFLIQYQMKCKLLFRGKEINKAIPIYFIELRIGIILKEQSR